MATFAGCEWSDMPPVILEWLVSVPAEDEAAALAALTSPSPITAMMVPPGLGGFYAQTTDTTSHHPRDLAAEQVRSVIETWTPEAQALLYVTMHDGLNLRYDTAKATLRKVGWR